MQTERGIREHEIRVIKRTEEEERQKNGKIE